MSDGPIHRSPQDVAVAIAQHRIDAGGVIIDENSIRARLTAETQARIDAIFHAEDGIYGLEQIRGLGCVPRD